MCFRFATPCSTNAFARTARGGQLRNRRTSHYDTPRKSPRALPLRRRGRGNAHSAHGASVGLATADHHGVCGKTETTSWLPPPPPGVLRNTCACYVLQARTSRAIGRSPKVVGPPALCVSAQADLVCALVQIERPIKSATSKRLRPIRQRYTLSAEHNADRSMAIASPLVRQYAPWIRTHLQKPQPRSRS